MSDTKSKFRGSFLFSPTNHGILYSTYQNTDEPRPFPETAKRIEGEISETIAGDYDTVWLELEGGVRNHVRGHLQITADDTIADVFQLEWSNEKGSVIYNGLGMMQRADLVGCYWKA